MWKEKLLTRYLQHSSASPYSTDLTVCDLWVFSTFKGSQRGHRFNRIEERESTIAIDVTWWLISRVLKDGTTAFKQRVVTLK